MATDILDVGLVNNEFEQSVKLNNAWISKKSAFKQIAALKDV